MSRRIWSIASACIVVMLLALKVDAEAADESVRCPTAVDAGRQLAQTETTDAPAVACCFEGNKDAGCTLHAPSRNGCEWLVAYQCVGGKYSCDDDAKICVCDAPAGETTAQ